MEGWLARVEVPLFVSYRRLRGRRSLPRASCRWALDSGAFSEIAEHGRWTVSEDAYVEAVERYAEEIGQLDWAAPMDWMCEPQMVERTGLSVPEHQHRTTENYLRLRDRGPFIPVLQGWTLADYERHVGLYGEAGVELASLPTVGVGSVCRRQNTGEIAAVMGLLNDIGLLLHGFGVKMGGYGMYARYLVSADSMAWSYNARKQPPLPGHTHESCANCLEWALRWRESLLARGVQLELETASSGEDR